MRLRVVIKKFIGLNLLIFLWYGNVFEAAAQFTFAGDYDRSFAAPNGYLSDPTDVIPERGDERTLLYTGELLPDGKIIAGGRLFGALDYFYLKKFTAAGAVDAAFGNNGIVVVNFFQRLAGSQFDPATGQSVEAPVKLKVQPDGKILFGGQCSNIQRPLNLNFDFGTDICLMRFNPDGAVDTTFGNNLVTVRRPSPSTDTETWNIGQGRVLLQTGITGDGSLRGTEGVINDILLQPDGKILLIGENRDFTGLGNPEPRQTAFIIRLNADGSPDNSFGTGGFARWEGASAGTPQIPCWNNRRFFGAVLEPNGKILALGHDSQNTFSNNTCGRGSVFSVSRWSASGALESNRTLAHVNFSGFGFNAAYTGILTGGNKLLVSGSNADKAILTRLNLGDLSVDTTFANNGFTEFLSPPTGSAPRPVLLIFGLQPDGKIIGRDNYNDDILRFNANGSSDQSYGNLDWNGVIGQLGRTEVSALFPSGQTLSYASLTALVRPNGKINVIGYQGGCLNNVFHCYGLVTQQNTVPRNGNYADFTNDGKSEIAVFRPSDGVWHQLSSTGGAYTAFNWGIGSDRLAPADYDGDGKTDFAVFRSGVWYIYRSTNNQFSIVNFGLAGDLPRPGDFDGDGLADIAVFRPSDGTWYRLNSSNNQFAAVRWGQNGDAPILADFDGDGKTDFTIFRGGVWYVLRSSDFEVRIVQFGLAGDVPAPGDYDADGKTDFAVFRSGTWYVQRSADGGYTILNWGAAGDKAVPADYDGDGKADFAVYRSGTWWILRSGNNSVSVANFGLPTDIPIQGAYLP